jgi:hypothetical protein
MSYNNETLSTQKRKLYIVVTIFLSLFLLYLTPVVPMNYYPFTMNDDTWHWFSQALYYLGYDTPKGNLAPLFSFIYALLFKLNLEKFMGLVVQLFNLLGVYSIYLIAKKLYNEEIAFLSVILLLFNHNFIAKSFYLNPDLMSASFLGLALATFLYSKEKPYLSIVSWIMISLAFYSHNYPGSILSFIVVILMLQGREAFNKLNFFGCLIYIILMFVYYLFFFNFETTKSLHLSYAGFLGLKPLWEYLIITFFALSPPVFFLLLVAIVYSLRNFKNEKFPFLILIAWFLPGYLFFSLIYASLLHSRFLTYFYMPLFIFAGLGTYLIKKIIKPKVVFLLILVSSLIWENFSRNPLFYDENEVLILPGVVLNAKGDVLTEANFWPAYLSHLVMSNEEKRLGVMRNIFPDELAELAEIIKEHVKAKSGEYYSIILPNYRLRARIPFRLSVLSERRIGDVNIETIEDPKRKILIFINLLMTDPQKTSELKFINEVVPYPEIIKNQNMIKLHIYDHGCYNFYKKVGIFEVYIRK